MGDVLPTLQLILDAVSRYARKGIGLVKLSLGEVGLDEAMTSGPNRLCQSRRSAALAPTLRASATPPMSELKLRPTLAGRRL